MMPWRFPSDPVHFTYRAPRAGDHVVLRLIGGPEVPSKMSIQGLRFERWAMANYPHILKQLVAFDEEVVRVKQYHPEHETVIPRQDILRAMRVIDRPELHGPFLKISRWR
jgi:hypothetical protein